MDTQYYYHKEVADFKSYCQEHQLRLPLAPVSARQLRQVDAAMASYFTFLFTQQYGPGKLRHVMFGFILLHTELDGSLSRPFPRANKLLKAVVKHRKGDPIDPQPEFVIMSLAYVALEKFGWLLSFAIVLQFDSYLRTINLLQIEAEHFSRPQLSAGLGYNSAYSLKVGTRGLPTKNGTYNHALLIGDVRPWLKSLMPYVLKALPKKGKIFPWSYAEYSNLLQQCLAFSSLDIKVTPHMLRHSAASSDCFQKLRSAEEIQRRGFWKSRRSVEIYERHASLLRSLEKIPDSLQKECRERHGRLMLELAGKIA